MPSSTSLTAFLAAARLSESVASVIADPPRPARPPRSASRRRCGRWQTPKLILEQLDLILVRQVRAPLDDGAVVLDRPRLLAGAGPFDDVADVAVVLGRLDRD